jgi:putative NIF3 family GTP cyclohydrolase 1 type 2
MHPNPMNNSSSLFQHSIYSRRTFIANTLKSAGGLTLLGLPTTLASANSIPSIPQKKQFTVQQVMDLILKEGGLTPLKDTVDTIKAGQADQVVSGIVTTMFPTVSVIEEAAKRNANFIMAHEPSFYNHLDDKDWVKDNKVLADKLQLLEKHNMVIWRFHDYCHSLKPDAVSYGVAKKANWLSYYKAGERILTIPSLSLKQLVTHLKSSLGIKQVRVIGNLDQACQRIALLPGAWGGQRHVSIAEIENPDVLVVGEAPEWETVEYIRDAQLQGRKMALIILGHSVSEEPGMEWLVDWLQPKLPDIKVSHIASGDPFTWL